MQEVPLIIPDIEALRTIRDNFLDELKRAGRGEKTSLAFIKNPLPPIPYVAKGEVFQVMSIGGSIFEQALVQRQKKKNRIIGYTSKKLPVLANTNVLLKLVSQHLDPGVRALAINFAYPLVPQLRNGVLDGKLIRVTKGHKLTGLVGKLVGKTLERHIARTTQKSIRVSVANDTICLILSGLAIAPWQHLVGGIVGTGTNFGFFHTRRVIINLESGNFNRFSLTETGAKIDRNSRDPGIQRFEKEVAGAYLYRHYNLIVGEGSFSLSSTRELNQRAMDGERIARQLFERSAALVACQIAGLHRLKRRQRLTFVMEGSLFWDGWQYKNFVHRHLRKLGVPRSAIGFVRVANSGILGAAALVTRSQIKLESQP